MESNTNFDQVNPAPSIARPAFLIVLCILTFIGSSYGVYSGISGYFTADFRARVMSETQNKMDEQMSNTAQPEMLKNFMGSMFSNMSADNIRKSSLINLIANLLTLGGAVLMWGFRKSGYYLYIAGTIIWIIIPLIFFGGGLLGGISSGLYALVGIAFIIMYGVNVKYMVK
ncbi:MAG: hypothetical protein JWO03_1975 [Bacteroidetes bacterium]|nr:hypothetical protein [Bacteroidota bacterium]